MSEANRATVKKLWVKPGDLHGHHSPDCRASGCIEVVAWLDYVQLRDSSTALSSDQRPCVWRGGCKDPSRCGRGPCQQLEETTPSSKEQLRQDEITAREAYPFHHRSRFLAYSDTDNAWLAGYRAALGDRRASEKSANLHTSRPEPLNP